MPEIIEVCPVEQLKPGEMRLVEWEDLEIGVFNCAGTVYAIEDRCSHDNGPLVEGELDQEACTIECPRHGSLFDLETGQPKTLPAYVPVDTFPVIIEDETIKLEVDVSAPMQKLACIRGVLGGAGRRPRRLAQRCCASAPTSLPSIHR